MMLSSLRASLARISLGGGPVTSSRRILSAPTSPPLSALAMTPSALNLSVLLQQQQVRTARCPSSTHVNGYYLPPPSKDDVWSRRYSHHDYCQLVNPLTGERRGMTTAFWRFKRLDWGAYIRPKGGRWRKLWRRHAKRLYERETHVFCHPFHNRRFERMFHPEWKEKRHLPDDIYEKYNRTSYFKHRWTKLKNRALVEQLGNPIHKFNRYKAHKSKHFTKYNLLETYQYEPPDYMRTVSDNGGVYDPVFVPQDTPAPHFQRPDIRHIKQMRPHKFHSVQSMMPFVGYPDPWLPIVKDQFKRY